MKAILLVPLIGLSACSKKSANVAPAAEDAPRIEQVGADQPAPSSDSKPEGTGNLTFSPSDQSIINGKHKTTISRSYQNEVQGKLILTAESALPKKEEVMKVMEPRGKAAMEALQPKDVWWYERVDGTLIPYAITQQSLAYLVERSQGYDWGTEKRYAPATMIYTADVVQHARFEYEGLEFRNVSVVTMNLEWSQSAMWFSKKRVVVFDKAGNVLEIFHDGVTLVMMS
jgi:hypothetical protein